MHDACDTLKAPINPRTYGLTLLGGFVAISALAWWHGSSQSFWTWTGSAWQAIALLLLTTGISLGTAGLVCPQKAEVVYRRWQAGSELLGHATNTIVLSVLYFVLLPPLALIRLKDPLRYRLGGSSSYWEDLPSAPPDLQRMTKPY